MIQGSEASVSGGWVGVATPGRYRNAASQVAPSLNLSPAGLNGRSPPRRGAGVCPVGRAKNTDPSIA